ncbi:hypothetical protein RN001_006102 [Aquatica leii]|uniref:Nuclear pore complex protein Nup155 n=1 Tax=Aquatica leii TaxID=1421715 RepID=A0AAN7QKS3_9COLE|nr:hypothetical protein RN001_006102 [Aquatica leii]
MDYSIDNSQINLHSVEIAARNFDKALASDSSAPTLLDIMNISPESGPTSSGAVDNDYPNLMRLPPALAKISQLKASNKIPLPAEILEQFKHIQCHSMMGLFTEINRAWLTVDSDIYLWTYEDGGDVAYYDGLNETIICVGLVNSKVGVFHSYIKYLLVLSTASDIIVLGVTFNETSTNELQEIHLVPDPVFTIPTDGSTITTIVGTQSGRIFLGSKDGSIFEISYQAESTWFGKRCKKLNHSTSTLSLLMPSFLNAALSEDDAIVQICIDNTRHILYALTEKGTIWLYDLGEKGSTFNKVSKLNQSSLVQQATNTVKTLDSQNFRPIVSISAVEASESGHINLVAVSETGVRFYLSVVGFSNMLPNQRPYTLTLRHVRLPPGYSATITARPRMVHQANYRDSNLMFLSSVNEKDVVWCISSDMFPFNSMFMEAYTTIPLDGPAMAMAEVTTKTVLPNMQPFVQAPQIAVRQHFEAPRKYVVLTAQGVHIFLKMRPVDLLRQLLIDCHGPENEAVKAFFVIQKEDQACATSLILACLESLQTADVSEWATRAFFLYGGEPKLAINQPFMQNTAANASFTPNVMSTPISPHLQMQQQTMSSPTMQADSTNAGFRSFNPFIYSSKHNGLYLYLSRILRPFWNMYCVEKLDVSDKHVVFLRSTVTADDCVWILSHLSSLWTFLKKNTHFSLNTTANLPYNVSQQSFNTSRSNQTLQDAQIEERQSLASLKNFVNHACQVLGLWRILCEHQFHFLVLSLPTTHQQILQNTSFKDLILYGQEICISFINSLITSYLSDNALIDTISSKLRETCPDLYKDEDAACSKAYELLKASKHSHSDNEKADNIASALKLCKSVAPNINLQEICQLLKNLNAFHAVVDLCVDCAKKLDPDNIADFYYKNEGEAGNQDSYNFYAKRMKVYKEILGVLDLLSSDVSTTLNSNINAASAEVQTFLLQQQDKIEAMRQFILDCLRYPDDLLHVAIYEWMMSKKMDGELIRISQPSLEKYLVKTSQQSQDNVAALELIWKYYESNNNHASAASILLKLSCKNGNGLTLKDRLERLARAVMCMRADKVGYAPHLGVFLRDLEDKLEIAKVQEQVLEAITNIQGASATAEEAINALNNNLYDLTQLYEEFSDPFNLWECKLSIIDCAGYLDSVVIENVWQHIIENEFRISTGSGDDKVTQLVNKVLSLIRRFKNSSSTVPLHFIIQKLEMISILVRANPSIIPTLLSTGVSMEHLVELYNLVVTSTTDSFWSLEENQFHLTKSFAELVNIFLNNKSNYDHYLRTKIKALSEDAVAKLLSSLYSKPNTDELISMLRSIQSKLSKC